MIGSENYLLSTVKKTEFVGIPPEGEHLGKDNLYMKTKFLRLGFRKLGPTITRDFFYHTRVFLSEKKEEERRVRGFLIFIIFLFFAHNQMKKG
jgi:hypothetical protein